MRFLDTLATLLGRVELSLAGAERFLRDGQDALVEGDAPRARRAAKDLLERVPGSPHGLALLADACELGGYRAELTQALEELAERLPSRADLWARLAEARRAAGAGPDDVRDAYANALAVAEPGSATRRETLLALADLDLAHADGARALFWLDRLGEPRPTHEVAVRRGRARLLRGDAAGALAVLEAVPGDATSGAEALVRGAALAEGGSPRAFVPLLRAYVLEEPGASEALSSALAWIPCEPDLRERIGAVVADREESDLPRFRAAFARADGRRDEARAALRAAVDAGHGGAVAPYFDACVEDDDLPGLGVAVAAARARTTGPSPVPDSLLDDAARLVAAEHAPAPLDALAQVTDDRLGALASRRVAEAASQLVPLGAPAAWGALLARLEGHARALSDLDALSRVAGLAVERARPVRLAVVGEFNAGKSTFINALVGADVAPTGVLPTTGTLHHLRYAPDAYSRIVLEGEGDRIVPNADLRAALRALPEGAVSRVEIHAPMPQLTRVEVLDTPGFNAPDPRHTARALEAFDEADVAVWLLDAAQPLKHSERERLEAARARGLPLLVLVNKLDRLDDAGARTVLDEVARALQATGLAPIRPPLGFSARLALAGKLGDADAGRRSGFAAVEELLDEALVGRSDLVKEGALRRRALGVARRLRDAAHAAEDAARASRRSDEARREAVGASAAALERDADELAATLAGALGPARAAWERDLRLVATGRDETRPDARHEERDPTIARYRVERALTHLAPVLARVLARFEAAPVASDAPATPDASSPAAPAGAAPPPPAALARTLVRAFAETARGSDVTPLARAAVAALAEALAERSMPLDAAGRASPAGARARELSALVDALAAHPPPGED